MGIGKYILYNLALYSFFREWIMRKLSQVVGMVGAIISLSVQADYRYILGVGYLF